MSKGPWKVKPSDGSGNIPRSPELEVWEYAVTKRLTFHQFAEYLVHRDKVWPEWNPSIALNFANKLVREANSTGHGSDNEQQG